MNTKLNQIRDWTPLARQAEWSVTKLAKLCGVSVRSLQRHFTRNKGKTPVAWLNEHRQKLAVELLRDGSSIKETAAELKYRHGAHFTRDFKKQWNCCPTQIYVAQFPQRGANAG